jgi:hypothetical protein
LKEVLLIVSLVLDRSIFSTPCMFNLITKDDT